MAELDRFGLGSCLGVGLLLLVSIFVTIQAQSLRFISIDCGSTRYSDPVTTFPWEGDDNYISTGMSGTVPIAVNSTSDNSEALKTFRYFPGGQTKHCYDLPTTGNVSFLLRAMFLHGSSPELTLPIKFDVAVNGTTLFPVQYNIGDSPAILGTPVVYEGIFFSPGILTHFCLVTDTGVPFISSLELREFDPEGIMYSVISFYGQSSYLERKWRINCGAQFGSPTVRYPDDPFDRLWQSPGDWPSVGFQSSTATVLNQARLPNHAVYNNVPQKVMQDAWLNDSANASFGFNFLWSGVSFSTACVYFYFQEIESNVSGRGRIFDLVLNGAYNILPNYTVGSGLSLVVVPDLPVTEWVNFTMTALPNSILGPIVNAIEIYLVHLFNDSATATIDVDSLASLQASFHLTDWQGDPCYPVSWNWVSCTGDTPARVQKLLLSNMGINATIPSTISDLDALVEIKLDNNSLYGTIPDSLATLQNLKFLTLNDNNLSGEVPPNLVRNLGSNFSYMGNVLLGAFSSSPNPSRNPSTNKATSIGVIIGAMTGANLGLDMMVVGVLLMWYFYSRKRKSKYKKVDLGISGKQTTTIPQLLVGQPSKVVGLVSYETVQNATDNFKVQIGEGSFGSVYHGWLNNIEVAVKVNNSQCLPGENEFITEVDILKRVHHRNLVPLIGYCIKGKEALILIYEFQVNGTLQEWLHDEGRISAGLLDWKTRLQIALDTAKGLEYLHRGCDPTIIHGNVKSTNVLLDGTMNGKLADFGLSNFTPSHNSSGHSSKVKGTNAGYLDPEYHMLQSFTQESDIFSYGVVLAEIITGRFPSQISTDGQVVVLVKFVQNLVETNNIEALADPNLRGAFNLESMWTMADIVLSCTARAGVRRPDITQIMSGITEAIQFEKTIPTQSPLVLSTHSA